MMPALSTWGNTATLFDRGHRDIRLTPQGARLKRYAEQLIAQWRKARQDVGAGADLQLALGGSLRLWDVALQDWLHDVKRSRPELAIIAEAHTPEVLTRRLLDGLLDVALMLEPAQLEVLKIVEVAAIELRLVSTAAHQSLEEALGEGYVMVDWGLAQALMHRRAFPDAPEPRMRLAQGKMALSFLHALGGSAYLPARMVVDDLRAGTLHAVRDAPPMSLTAHAVYPVRSAREALIL